MEGEGVVIRSIIEELRSADMVKWQVKKALLEVSLMKFILGISKKFKWKVKVVLREVSLMNFILPTSKEIKWKAKVVLIEVS